MTHDAVLRSLVDDRRCALLNAAAEARLYRRARRLPPPPVVVARRPTLAPQPS